MKVIYFKQELNNLAVKIRELKLLYKAAQKEQATLQKKYGTLAEVRSHCQDPSWKHPYYSIALKKFSENRYDRERYLRNLRTMRLSFKYVLRRYRNQKIAYLASREVVK